MIKSIFKSLLNTSRGRSLKDQCISYLSLVFVWCPLATVFFSLGFGGWSDHLFAQFLISLTIAVVVGSSCFFGAWALRACLTFYRSLRCRPPFQDNLWTGMLRSYPFLLPGLYVGFYLGGRVSERLGVKWAAPRFTDYSSGVIFGMVISGVFAFLELVRKSRVDRQASEVALARAENEKLRAQISALTAQMNPHLLFNSLNTIAETIVNDPLAAETMTVQLSELYRGILRAAKGDTHSLADEIDLCRAYLEIEQKRFGPKIRWDIRVSDSICVDQLNVPVLLLQPLVENAVQHGLMPKREGGCVGIEVGSNETHLMIRVSDDGVGFEKKTERENRRNGSALANCESRIRLQFGELSRLTFLREPGDLTVASIYLPHVSLA